MTISMYQASIPVFIRALTNLAAILEKGEAHANAKGFDSAVLVSARLAPDMYPLSRQIQIATDMVKAFASRISGETPPSWPDTEQSMAELIGRVQKALELAKAVTPDQIDGKEDASVEFKIRGEPAVFSGLDYLQKFVLPNIYFHSSIAYAILRHNGVELGKRDFLGSK